MSRYVDHKHGLTVGSDNVFFVIDRADRDYDGEPPLVLPERVAEVRDGYRAIVYFKGYSFDQFDMLNVRIRTPAQQLVWKIERLEWTRPWEHNGKTIDLPMRRDCYHPHDWVVKWLETNVGPKYDRWDTYSRGSRSSQTLFFRRRKDALAFVHMVDARLKGIKVGRFW